MKFQLRGRLAWLSLCSNSGKQKRYLQIFRQVSGVFQQNFNGSKIVLSSSRGQGNFWGPKASRPRPRTWGFEVKAKDFKMCPRGRPRGQGRPRGLHLWSEVQISGWSNRTQCCQRFATAAIFLRKKLGWLGTMTRRWAPQTHYTLRRITTSIMKDLITIINSS